VREILSSVDIGRLELPNYDFWTMAKHLSYVWKPPHLDAHRSYAKASAKTGVEYQAAYIIFSISIARFLIFILLQRTSTNRFL
jgi:hypothetical protein